MTTIAWTNETWNPIAAYDINTGKRGWFCQKVSPGCTNCYAEAMNRYRGNGHQYRVGDAATIRSAINENTLTKPIKWRTPKRIFVCSMTDLFLDSHSDEMIAKVFAVMALARQHSFQVLTKRPERARTLLNDPDFAVAIVKEMRAISGEFDVSWMAWPLPNVWMGTSAEDQNRANERIPQLLQTPAAIRWVSYEPALGPIMFRQSYRDYLTGWDTEPVHVCGGDDERCRSQCPEPQQYQTPRLDWIVVGGESGTCARPFDPAWARSVVEECRETNVAAFVKQMGKWVLGDHDGFRVVDRWKLPDGRVWVPGVIGAHNYERPEGAIAFSLFDAKGEDINEWPEDLRVREYPPNLINGE